jgi:hypothetical protein
MTTCSPAFGLLTLLLASCGALQAAILQDNPAFNSLSGSGLGSVSTVLTVQSPGNSTTATGCSFWTGTTSAKGTNCPITGYG